MDDDEVKFAYRDRKDGGRRKLMALPAQSFMRRFLLHVLPKGFTIFGAPQRGFAVAILRMRSRSSRAIRGRPGFGVLFFLQ